MKNIIFKMAIILSSLLPQLSHAILVEGGAVYEDGTTFDFVASVDESYVWQIGDNTMNDTGLLLLDLDYTLNSGGIVYTPGNSIVSLVAFELSMSSCTDPLEGCIDSWLANIWDDDFIFQLVSSGMEIIPPSAIDVSFVAISSYVQASPMSNSVPEPTSLALLGLGLAGMGVARRKSCRAAMNQGGTHCRLT